MGNNNFSIRHMAVCFEMSFILLLISCSARESKHNTTKTIQHDGYIEIQTIDPKGKLLISQEFTQNKDGSCVKTGHYQEFYEDGRTKTLGFFKNGKKDSTCTFYATDGTILAKQTYFDGVMIGKECLFYPNGNLKRVNFALTDSSSMFYIDYSNEGKIVKFKGTPCLVLIPKKKIEYKKTDTLDIVNLCASSDEIKAVLNIRVYDKTGSCYFNFTTHDFSFEKFLGIPYTFVEMPFKQGDNKYITITELRDSRDDKLIIRDTSVTHIKVK